MNENKALKILKEHPISNAIISFALGVIVALGNIGVVPQEVQDAAITTRQRWTEIADNQNEIMQLATTMWQAVQRDEVTDETLQRSIIDLYFKMGLLEGDVIGILHNITDELEERYSEELEEQDRKIR